MATRLVMFRQYLALPRGQLPFVHSLHYHRLTHIPVNFRDIPQHGGSSQVSRLRYHNFIVPTHVCVCSYEGRTGGTEHVIEEEQGSMPSFNQLYIGQPIIQTSDPRSLGLPTV